MGIEAVVEFHMNDLKLNGSLQKKLETGFTPVTGA